MHLHLIRIQFCVIELLILFPYSLCYFELLLALANAVVKSVKEYSLIIHIALITFISQFDSINSYNLKSMVHLVTDVGSTRSTNSRHTINTYITTLFY